MTETRRGLSRDPATLALVALVAVRVLALGLVLADAAANPITDVDVLRAERIATSPVTPYRNFPVEYMPLQTAMIELLGGDGASSTATRVAIVAFLADLAAAGGILWGFGRRPATTYLVLGLPLLSFLYLRFDLVAVALAVWAVALLARERELPSGAALGLAVMAKLWPVVLVPLWLVRRQRRGLLVAAGVVVVVGVAWYVVGGPKGPFQVLSFREARGWHTQSLVGGLAWLLGLGTPYPEAGALRIAHAAPLAATAALLVVSPLVSMQTAVWLVPWTALALEGDQHDRVVAGWATASIVLTGVLAALWSDPSSQPSRWVAAVVLARNLATIGIVASWLAGSRRRGVHAAATAAP